MTTPHESAMLEEIKADNLQDDARARDLVNALISDTRVRQRMSESARQSYDANASLMRHAIGEQTAVLQSGPGISQREVAVYILANLAASASAATARRILTERLALLEELAPLPKAP